MLSLAIYAGMTVETQGYGFKIGISLILGIIQNKFGNN